MSLLNVMRGEIAARVQDLIRVDADFQPTTDDGKWAATYDPVRQLTYMADLLIEGASLARAKKAAEDCRLLNKSGWQLFDVTELIPLLDFEKAPACRAGIFKGPLDRWIWTRTPYPNSAGGGRVVYLSVGGVDIGREGDRYSARAVLAGQQLHLTPRSNKELGRCRAKSPKRTAGPLTQRTAKSRLRARRTYWPR